MLVGARGDRTCPFFDVRQAAVAEQQLLDLVAGAFDEAVAVVDRAAVRQSTGRAEHALPLRDEAAGRRRSRPCR